MTLLLPLLLACGSPAVDSGKTVPVDSGELTVSGTDIATVLAVSWDGEAWPDATLHWSDADGLPVEVAGTPDQALVRGLPSFFEVELILRDSEGVELARTTTETGGLPAAVPAFEVSVGGLGDLDGVLVVPVFTEQATWATVIDASGRLLWALALDPPEGSRVLVTRAVPLPDQSGVVVLSAPTEGDPTQPEGQATVQWWGWDGALIDEVAAPLGHTDHVLLPDGRVAFLAKEEREVEEWTVIGDQLVIATPLTGDNDIVWSSWETMTLPDLEWLSQVDSPDGPKLDWTHANGLSYDAATGHVLMSVGNVHQVIAVDPETGGIVWSVSDGDDSTTWQSDAEAPIILPHSAQAVPGGVLAFNRASSGGAGSCSAAVEYELDPSSERAEAVWVYRSEDCMEVNFLGSAWRMPSGDTLVDFSSLGQVDLVDADAQLKWRMEMGLGAAVGFVEALDNMVP